MAVRTLTANTVPTLIYTATQVPNINGGFTVGVAGQYQIWSDRAVWDTVNNVFLFPSRDFNPYALFVD